MLRNKALIEILGNALDTLAGMEAINGHNNQALADAVDYDFHEAEESNDADKAAAAFQLYLTILISRATWKRCADCGAIKVDCEMFRVEEEHKHVCGPCYSDYEMEEWDKAHVPGVYPPVRLN